MLEKAVIAGLIAGEGSFVVQPNNGESSWTCGFTLGLRDDDASLLSEMRDTVGCGSLYRRAAQGNARPQLVWTLSRMADCRRFERFLANTPLLSKKRGDFDLWRTALDLWTNTGLAQARWPRMADVARRLKEYRSPLNVVTRSADEVSPAYLDAFLSGFASAEAHFGATRSGHPRFVINLRTDDASVLAQLHEHTGLGRLRSVEPHASSWAATKWHVTTIAEARQLVAVLDDHLPVGKALQTYAAWRAVVNVAGRRPSDRPTETAIRRELARCLIDARAYRPSPVSVINQDKAAERHRRAIASLAAWSRAMPAPYTSPRYEEWRASQLSRHPTRNTLALSFGSWRAALEAAGISTEHCFPAQRIARAQMTYGLSREARIKERRRVVCQAVRACTNFLGHEPRASEFFRWRHDAAGSSPTQGTVYRAFPGGWAEVLAAARVS